MYLQRKGTKT